MNHKHLLKTAEEKGLVADSLEVRKQLMIKVHSGEISLQEAQSQLKKIQQKAHTSNLYVRNDFYQSSSIDLNELHEKNLKNLNNKLNSNLNIKDNEAKKKL